MRTRGLHALLVSALVVQACGGGGIATFRAAKNAPEQPSLKEAFRVKAVAPDCVLVGYVNADGDHALEDIGETAAYHGANSYLIVNENRDERVTERGNNELRSHTNRKLLAEAYRCPMSGDLPK
jgi:hypothetical protein